MKRIVILFFAIVTAFSAHSQTYLQDGDRCFDSGDYTCAITKYDEEFKLASGKDKQLVEIKLTRAKFCQEHIKLANTAFTNKQYSTAKTEYQTILESNPKDTYAQSQLGKCNNMLNPPTPTLSVSTESLSFSASGGTSEQVKVSSNAGTYSVKLLPSWCTVQTYSGYFVITCSANIETTTRNDYFTVVAGDKTVRINVSQAGKVQTVTPPKTETTLSVSKSTLYFVSYGETSEQIKVYSNASTYSVSLLPSWCTVQTYSGYFTVTASANPNYTSRKDWFKVTAGGKEVKVYVNQAETTYTPAQKSNVSQKPVQQKTRKCFNCPQGDMSAWGLTFGYVQTDYIGEAQSGLQMGIKYEPLFKYGFGLNFGLNYEYYNYNYDSFEIEENTLNLGAGLEYRFNFSKWFSPYIYGGVSFDYNLSANATYDSESYNLYDYTDYAERFSKYVDFGVGLRINHLQLNISKSVLWDYFENSNNSFIDNPGKVVFSVAYIF